MIFKSITTVIFLILIFEICLRMMPVKWDTSQNDKTANSIEIQNFVYNLSKKNLGNDTIIVGSSMSIKLVTDSLGPKFFNLGLHNCSGWDGLYLLKKSKVKPACILIESNVLNDIFIKDEVENVLNPIDYFLKPLLISSQLQNQPVGLITGFLRSRMKQKIDAIKKANRTNEALYNSVVELNREAFKIALPDSVYRKRLTELKSLVNYFQSQQVKIIFFEMPVDKALRDTEKVISIREQFKLFFPLSMYNHVQLPHKDYTYSDGIHLSPESAEEYTAYLKSSILSVN